MADEQRRNDPGDVLRDGVRAFAGVLGAFKEAIEQTFDDLSKRGDLSPERARESAGDAMKRAQEAFDEMRGRVDFVTRKEFETLRQEISELRSQIDRHTAFGGHHAHGGAAGSAAGTAPGAGAGGGTGGTTGTGGTGAAGSSMGDGSPGL